MSVLSPRSPKSKTGWKPYGAGMDVPTPTADDLWDAYQSREVKGADALPTTPPHAGWKPGAGGERGMGAGGVYIGGKWHDDLADPGKGSYDSASDYNADAGKASKQGGQNLNWGGGTNQPAQTGNNAPGNQPQSSNVVITPDEKARLAIDAARQQQEVKNEENRHGEVLAKIAQDWKIHQDDNQRRIDENAENARHNAAVEANQAEATRVQERMNALDNATKLEVERMSEVAAKELEGMKEANAVLLESMQEGNKILMEQGQEAFKDWQTRQASMMTILSSALNNPWLQQLTGMAPPGGEAAVMGGGNIQGLLQKILAPYDYTKAYGGQSQAVAPGATDALNQNAQAGPAGAQGQPGAETVAPSYGDWQAWSPFQKAAYRTNIEALGPGAWQTQQQAAQNQFTSEGGSPDITPLAGMSASPLQNIGQQMTAEMFGQTPDQWQKAQSRQWSQAQAPQVKQSLSTGVTKPASSSATPEQQFGI